ncbi:MAG: WbuC family cupin fold metalloprotein, partial [Myxococcales bacterium]|nr:WbuC family cupin fold metalloprotein [Myxococcales bacterium]
AGQLARASGDAAASPRRRSILRFHDHDEAVQRMINAIEPDSYVRPHRHQDPDKTELFLALQGRACMCRFDDDGRLRQTVEVAAAGPNRGVEIPPGVWHCMVALEPATVLFEVIEGPFTADTHKHYAPWAPAEGSDAGAGFLAALRERIRAGADAG